MTNYLTSPCMRCTRVSAPCDCEDKSCAKWRRWFIENWDTMRRQPRLQKELPGQQQGVYIGGVCYTQPHRVHTYLNTDPCDKCLCPRDLCTLPCREKRTWQMTRRTVFGDTSCTVHS